MNEKEYQVNPVNGTANLDPDLNQPAGDEEISVIDVMLVMVRNRRVIFMSTICFGLLGLLIALFSAREYTSSAKLIRENESDVDSRSLSGLSLLSNFGLNLGSGAAGLTPDAYPDIVESREVRLAVVRDTFFFPDVHVSMTFVSYVNQPPDFLEVVGDYTIRLPWTIKNSFKKERSTQIPFGPNGLPDYPTLEEEEALKEVVEMVKTSVDTETGLMRISATTPYPVLSATLTQSFVDHLAERVREIRTQKSRQSLLFIQKQFEEAQKELRAAETKLAEFEDRNINPQGARLLTESARLQRQVTFKTELYSNLQAQLTQAQINLQRSEPVITLLEQPVPPIESSGSSRMLTVLWLMLLGSVFGVGIAFVSSFIKTRSGQEEERVKIDELKNFLITSKIIKRLKSLLKSLRKPGKTLDT